MGARFVRANGLRFAYLAEGPEDGPLALCLHGFPDTAHTWRYLLPRLAAEGFRAVAPWMRGYAPTEVPYGRTVPRDTLAADVNALHRALGGGEDAVLVGHDWGAYAAYRAAAAAPGRWRRVVTLAVPPDRALAGANRDPAQMRRSWYMLAFQVPGAERLVARDDFALVERLWRDWSPGYDPTEELPHVTMSLKSPGSLAAALGYYRALGSRLLPLGTPTPGSGRVNPQPTLYLHGADDGCMGVSYAERAREVLRHPASLVEVVPDAGHFLHLERPEVVGATITGFLVPA
jgi:pimeloyl-ACP methyl ester carboxylesterase